jgi:hypothetical protein
MEEFSPGSQQFSPQLPITSDQCQQLMSMLQHYFPPVIPLASANTVGSMHNHDHFFFQK